MSHAEGMGQRPALRSAYQVHQACPMAMPCHARPSRRSCSPLYGPTAWTMVTSADAGSCATYWDCALAQEVSKR